MPIRSVSFSFSYDRLFFFYSFAFRIHSPVVLASLLGCSRCICMLCIDIHMQCPIDWLDHAHINIARVSAANEKEWKRVGRESEWVSENKRHIYSNMYRHTTEATDTKLFRVFGIPLCPNTQHAQHNIPVTYIFIYVCSIIFIRDLNWIQLNDGMVEMYAAASECLNARIGTRIRVSSDTHTHTHARAAAACSFRCSFSFNLSCFSILTVFRG